MGIKYSLIAENNYHVLCKAIKSYYNIRSYTGVPVYSIRISAGLSPGLAGKISARRALGPSARGDHPGYPLSKADTDHDYAGRWGLRNEKKVLINYSRKCSVSELQGEKVLKKK